MSEVERQHLTPEDLVAYEEDALPPEGVERVRDHLATCKHCTQLFLGYKWFMEVPEASPDERAAEARVAQASWQEVRERLKKEGKIP